MNNLIPTSIQSAPTLFRVRQSGFSLIELMVAVTIGLFITLGLSQMFVSMYTTSRSQNTLASYQDNQRLAIVMLTNTVQLAGYFPNPSTQTATSALHFTAANTDGSSFTDGIGLTGAGDGGATIADSIDVAYITAGGDNIYNCQGGTATVQTGFINSISVNSSNQLICGVKSIVTGTTTTSNALVLATGVTSMKVLYGVDVAGAGTTGSYLTASAVQTAALWGSVRTVQITLNFTPPAMLNGASTTAIPWIQTINLMRVS